jgi:hypothetical protein
MLDSIESAGPKKAVAGKLDFFEEKLTYHRDAKHMGPPPKTASGSSLACQTTVLRNGEEVKLAVGANCATTVYLIESMT